MDDLHNENVRLKDENARLKDEAAKLSAALVIQSDCPKLGNADLRHAIDYMALINKLLVKCEKQISEEKRQSRLYKEFIDSLYGPAFQLRLTLDQIQKQEARRLR